jgi:hypothetical protein
MRRRGQALLFAQRPGPPLGPPPATLTEDEVRAWQDIVDAAPDVLRELNRSYMYAAAVSLAHWRAGERDMGLRFMLRLLGHLLVPMRTRRQLLFPERPVKNCEPATAAPREPPAS